MLEEKSTKLGPLGEKCVFVGYNETLKAYMIFMPAQLKIVVSRDVKFEENLASRKSRELTLVPEDEEQVVPKGEQSSQISSSRSQPSGEKEELAPSIFVRRPRWFE